MARAADAIVVCKAHGPDVIVLDWQGQPIELLPQCPDCALAAGPMPVASGQLARPDEVVLALGVVTPRSLNASAGNLRTLWPRAPPV